MLTKTDHLRTILLGTLCLTIVCGSGFSALADEQPATKTTVEDFPKTSAEAQILEILSRQKGDQLKIYLNSRSAYINGKSVSRKTIPTIIEKSELKKVAISAEPYVMHKDVVAMMDIVKSAGVDKITLSIVKSKTPTAEEQVKTILSRQKGKELKVYLNSKGTYVNGKSVSLDLLTKVAKQSKLETAILTAESEVATARVQSVIMSLQEGGIEKFTLTSPKAKPE